MLDSIYLGFEFKINSINYYLLSFENPLILILYLSDLTIYLSLDLPDIYISTSYSNIELYKIYYKN